MCEYGYLLSPINSCLNMSGCYSLQINSCYECDSQNYLSNGTCIYNEYPCIKSEMFSQRCYECAHGYYLANNYQCYSCVKNCDYCINGNSCIQCFYNFYYNNNTKTCEQCPQNCASCSNGNSCDKCSGFYQYDGGKCVCNLLGSCDDTILYFSSSLHSLNPVYCPVGNFLDENNICRPCLQGCKNCTSSLVCIECYNSFCLKGAACYNQTQKLCNYSYAKHLITMLIFYLF